MRCPSPIKSISRVYHNHAELIKQAWTLSLTTCVLASKIFPRLPSTIPNLSLLMLRYTGICFIGAQIQHLHKSHKDLIQSVYFKDAKGICFTSAKVAVKAANVFLTIAQFCLPLLLLSANASLAAGLMAVLIPLSRSAWGLGCANELSDYFLNRRLRHKLTKIQKTEDDVEIFKLMQCFESLLQRNRTNWKRGHKSLALRLIRQCEGSTLDIFRKEMFNISSSGKKEITLETALKAFEVLKLSLNQKSRHSEAGTALSTLGYASMHISKLYPDSAVEWGLRWSMSVLYLLKSTHKKIFHQRIVKKFTI